MSKMGDLEVLNDVGLGEAREVISVYNKTRTVMGVPQARNGNTAAVVNRAYGHTKNMRTRVDSVSDIPYAVRDLKELERYTRALIK